MVYSKNKRLLKDQLLYIKRIYTKLSDYKYGGLDQGNCCKLKVVIANNNEQVEANKENSKALAKKLRNKRLQLKCK